MSKSKGLPLLHFVCLFLVSSSSMFSFSPYSMVYGSNLQEQRSFNRPDPIQHFKLYNGSYDLRNKHYIASVAFTGIHGYAIAAIWTLCGVVFAIFLVMKNPSDTSSSSSSSSFLNSESYYFIMLMLILLFTFLAMVASSFVIAANQSSLKRAKKLEKTIVNVGGNAQKIIRKVTNALIEMQYLLKPYDSITSRRLNSTNHQLLSGSQSVRRFVQKNGHSIDLVTRISYIVHLAIVSINLVLLVAALVLLLLHWHSGFVIIIFVCWILTALCWVLTGFDYFLYTFVEDTCSAFEEFELNPHNNSLSSILPCIDPSHSDTLMVEIGSTVHKFITKLNSKVNVVYKKLLDIDEENDDSLLVWKICDPFSGAPNYTYIPGNCPKNTIPVRDLPNVLARFTCYNENSTGTCKSLGKFLPEAYYTMAWSYSRSIQNLIDIFPDLQSLEQCSFVKDALSDVVSHQCRPLRVSVRLLWSSVLSLSIFMVGLVLTWVAKTYQDRGKPKMLHHPQSP